MAATLTDERSRQVWELEDRQSWILGPVPGAHIRVEDSAFGQTSAVVHSSGVVLASYNPAGGPRERRPGVQARWWIQRRYLAAGESMRVGGFRVDHEDYFPLLDGDRLELGSRVFAFAEQDVPPFDAELCKPFDWSAFRDSLDSTIKRFGLDRPEAGTALRRFARNRANTHVIAGAYQAAIVRHPVIATLVQPRDRVRAAAMRSIALRGLADLARSNRLDREATRLVVAPYLEDAMPGVRMSAEIAVASTEEHPTLAPLVRSMDEALASRAGGVGLEAADAVRVIAAIDPSRLGRLCDSAEATARDAGTSRRRRTAALALGALREHRETRRAERPLVALRLDPSPPVRLGVIEAFASAPPAVIAEHVRPLLDDPSPEVFRAASRALLNGRVPGLFDTLVALRERIAGTNDPLAHDRIEEIGRELDYRRPGGSAPEPEML